MSYSWEHFANYVRTQGRYLFLRTGRRREDDDPDLFEPSRVLDEVAKAIHNGAVTRTLPAGTKLVRARVHASNEVLDTPAELGSPPVAATAANRMSPAGISMFYAAETVETALAEVRPGPAATAARWSTARDLRFLDLAELPSVPSVFDQFARVRRPWVKFLWRFSVEIARPVAPDAEPVEYVPTQIFTEFLRDVALDQDGEPLEGIRYSSAVHPGGLCWVLFVGPDGCSTAPDALLQFDESSVQRFQPDWRPAPSAPEDPSGNML